MVRKSTLNRVRPEVFGTVECSWAAEKARRAFAAPTTRRSVSGGTSSVTLGWLRVSLLTCLAASARPTLFHWYGLKPPELFGIGRSQYSRWKVRAHSGLISRTGTHQFT